MDIDIRAYAKIGAQARLDALTAEINSIKRAFPALGRATPGKARTEAEADGRQPARAPRRRRMSAAAKKAVGERMKRYWAAKRKAGAGADAGPQPGEKAAGATTGESEARTAPSAAKKKAVGTRKRARKGRKQSSKKR